MEVAASSPLGLGETRIVRVPNFDSVPVDEHTKHKTEKGLTELSYCLVLHMHPGCGSGVF
jgi:hypothetical protein